MTTRKNNQIGLSQKVVFHHSGNRVTFELSQHVSLTLIKSGNSEVLVTVSTANHHFVSKPLNLKLSSGGTFSFLNLSSETTFVSFDEGPRTVKK
jgi:hypothetical protein